MTPSRYALRMGTYLAILNGAADTAAETPLTQAQQAEFMTAWARWARETGPALVDPGKPLFHKRRVTADGVEAIEDGRVAYAIVTAESHDAAVDVVRRHPHLTLMPGNSIDVIECPDIPVQAD